MAASPRISFSQCIPNASDVGGERHRADGSPPPLEQGEGDFDFSIGFPISADHSSNADELFSNGKILPFFKNPSTADNKPHGPQPRLMLDRRGSLREFIDYSTGSSDDGASTAGEIRGTGRRSFWRFGRSSSVGSVVDHGPISSFSLDRCKSTGSFPNQARRQQPVAGTTVGNLKLRSNSNQKKTYYFSGSQRGCHGGAVRINPILNLPGPIITTSSGGGCSGGGSSGSSNGAIAGIFSYLLCNCGGEGKRDEMGDFLTASQQNGTAAINCGR